MLERTPLTPDPMMDELHAIRRANHETTKNMTTEEKIRWYHDQAVALARENGYELVESQTRPKAYRMVPAKEAPSAT